MADDARLGVRWQAFRAPHVGLLPPQVIGTPNGPSVIVLVADGSTSGGAARIDLTIGNGPQTEDRRRHVLEVAAMFHKVAEAIEADPEVCAAALEDHLADLALAVADAEHREGTPDISEPPC